jgi:hypothetical protein
MKSPNASRATSRPMSAEEIEEIMWCKGGRMSGAAPRDVAESDPHRASSLTHYRTPAIVSGMRCAFLTLDDPTGHTIDDALAIPPLLRLGWSVDSVPWRRRGEDWSSYDAVVIRSTWDYARDPDAFVAVLAEITRSGASLFNPLDLVTWNLRKTYLLDLANRGVPTVPTVWRERLHRGELHDLLGEVGASEMVVKPVVGAGGHGAFHVSASTGAREVAEIEAYFAGQALMAQPFLRAILMEGEFSLFYFNGEHSHSTLKTPNRGEFRVQEEHGGSSVAVHAEPALLAAGDGALRTLGDAPLYARADFVRANGADDFLLIELELIEPSMYLRMDAGAPERFARALHERVPVRARSLPSAHSLAAAPARSPRDAARGTVGE